MKYKREFAAGYKMIKEIKLNATKLGEVQVYIRKCQNDRLLLSWNKVKHKKDYVNNQDSQKNKILILLKN